MLKSPDLPAILLRVGLAFVFAYAAISSLVNPEDWVGYLPGFVNERLTFEQVETMLKVFSIFEIALAAWLLSGWMTFWAALASAAGLLGIIISSPSQFLITFRDVGLLATALALAALSKPKH